MTTALPPTRGGASMPRSIRPGKGIPARPASCSIPAARPRCSAVKWGLFSVDIDPRASRGLDGIKDPGHKSSPYMAAKNAGGGEVYDWHSNVRLEEASERTVAGSHGCSLHELPGRVRWRWYPEHVH